MPGRTGPLSHLLAKAVEMCDDDLEALAHIAEALMKVRRLHHNRNLGISNNGVHIVNGETLHRNGGMHSAG